MQSLHYYISPSEFLPFTNQEIRYIIRSSKNNKAPGPDYILNEHIKGIYDESVSILTMLFNSCIESSDIPTEWKHPYIKVLFKGKGDTLDTNSYRGIANSSNLVKPFSRAIASRLDTYTLQ
jgi:hypothetical protein